MEFVVGTSVVRPIPGRWVAYLLEDRWDDWGKFRTQFYLLAFDEAGQKYDIGNVKIGQAGLRPSGSVTPGFRAPQIPRAFTSLDDSFFSLGQDETYYEALQSLPQEKGDEVLAALRDCAQNLEIFDRNAHEEVTGESLLRFVSSTTVRAKFHRLANGNSQLTEFDFSFVFTGATSDVAGPVLDFRVRPEATPPTNVHVLIGRNGAGKTRFLQALARSIIEARSSLDSVGNIQSDLELEALFSGLVYVSFSAFDSFELPPSSVSTLRAAQVSLIGEGAVSDRSGQTTKKGARIFSKSFEVCRVGLRRRRWIEAIEALEGDPLFEEAKVTSLADLSDGEWRDGSEDLFSKLSSGHAVVLLTVTRLVELVDEKTIVLMDEPEGHLHPPLLAALVRSISDLLSKRNGLAVIATHSPVVLQEVPRSCAWILRRSGLVSVAERPQFETFGENVGSLTREVFGLEVTASGFHKMVADTVRVLGGNYEQVLETFNGQLGTEARAIARGLGFDLTSERRGNR